MREVDPTAFGVHRALDREPRAQRGVAGGQLQILWAAEAANHGAQLVVDALIGYSLYGVPQREPPWCACRTLSGRSWHPASGLRAASACLPITIRDGALESSKEH